MESNIKTSRTADISFSCLLCPRRMRLEKIDISNTVAFLECFDYIAPAFKSCRKYHDSRLPSPLESRVVVLNDAQLPQLLGYRYALSTPTHAHNADGFLVPQEQPSQVSSIHQRFDRQQSGFMRL